VKTIKISGLENIEKNKARLVIACGSPLAVIPIPLPFSDPSFKEIFV